MTRQLMVSRTANGQEVMIRQVGKGKSLSETRGIFRCAEWKIENGEWKMENEWIVQVGMKAGAYRKQRTRNARPYGR